jgi:integrase
VQKPGQNIVGPELSEWVFQNFDNRRHPLQRGGRKAWAKGLEKAGLPIFSIHYLRHTFASRLTSAAVSPLTIAQMLRHPSTHIVPGYPQVMDQSRLDAMMKFGELKKSATEIEEVAQSASDEIVREMRQ